ncbi:MAG: family 78 glycoside hydrolase catalytic domain [Planctomycetota bacterium]
MSATEASPRATSLRCEYLTHPLGIDERSPRLSWRFEDPATARGAIQTAYQIVAAASAEQLDDEPVWDTGKVASSRTAHVVYEGPPLEAGERVWWRVCVWNGLDAASAWSEPAWWEMGLLSNDAWSARWIGPQAERRDDITVSQPAPLVRREFDVVGPVARARLYVTARGLYAARINGRRVGDDELAPGWTDYRRRLQYRTYDVTDLLGAGVNALAVTLADGWYSGNLAGFASRHRGRYGRDPQLLLQLVIEAADGTRQTVGSDETWRWADGPWRSADLYKGEHYDARAEMPGWDRGGYDDSAWAPVQVYDAGDAVLEGKRVEPVRVIERITPIGVSEPTPGAYVFDMGQNMVGRVRLRLPCKAGATVTLRHAEVLNADGAPYTENLRSADQIVRYTAAVDGPAEYAPSFTFQGFRYVEVTGLDAQPERDALVGEVLHNAMRPTGSFECSDATVNQLQHNITWGQKGNYLEVPTDCPQRDERLGWTGDAQVFVRTGAFNFDIAAFFTKWLNDLHDSQKPDGAVPHVAPDVLSSGDRAAAGAAAWGDAAVICPWTIYLSYGDVRVLEARYDMMAGWLAYQRDTSDDLIRPRSGFGDWLAMDVPGGSNDQTATPKDLVGTAYFAYTARLMARIARLLGKTDDASMYDQLAADVVKAFDREFVTPAGRVMGDTQTSYSLTLNLGLLDDDRRETAARRLIEDIRARRDHITTGFVGVNQIMFALTAAGQVETNYRLLFQDTYPSWLMPVLNGATTIWERWDGWTPDRGFQSPSMNSFNHYAYGCVGEWLYRCCAGLDVDEARPGYEHSLIRPHPDPTGRMTWATARLDSIRGRIASGWAVDGETLTVKAEIPANTTATVFLPAATAEGIAESGRPLAEVDGVADIRQADGRVEIEIGSGTYTFTCKG